ncbi:hypothetical protein E2C01_019519 [Portunus trituberculatus]|uniref:Uncharacterized protein n=1 Tax=Portunus trituberculatus TaxID=210409 RepID=A0A5B7E0N2_PORTR|nr:hypothetical protein [Portunus trituberculatus]
MIKEVKEKEEQEEANNKRKRRRETKPPSCIPVVCERCLSLILTTWQLWVVRDTSIHGRHHHHHHHQQTHTASEAPEAVTVVEFPQLSGWKGLLGLVPRGAASVPRWCLAWRGAATDHVRRPATSRHPPAHLPRPSPETWAAVSLKWNTSPFASLPICSAIRLADLARGGARRSPPRLAVTEAP